MSQVTPYLSVPDTRSALLWYGEVFGATVTQPPMVMPDGRVGHSEFEIDGARFMMADAHPELQCPAPAPGLGSPVTLYLTVSDVDTLVARATAAGAQIDRSPQENAVGRGAILRDPSGHRWYLNEPAHEG